MYLLLRNVTSVCVIIISVFFLNSCKNTTSTSLEESLEFVRSVEPITAAQNATINIKNDHEGALFTVELSKIESNSIINDGIQKAWCIEYDVPSHKQEQTGVKLHSTKGQNLWKPLNYFLNKKEELKLEYPDLGWKEIQIVIWALVEHKPFDMDRISEYQYLSPEFYHDGQYLFDIELSKNIVQLVKQNVGKQKGFLETVFAIIVENKGQTVIIESGETVWAYGQHSFRNSTLRELLGFSGTGVGQWGWIFELESDQESTELIAGGGNDDGTKPAEEVGTIVGSLDIEKSGDMLQVTYNMDSNYLINDLHFWVGCSLEDFPWKGPNGNVAPGSLPYKYDEESADNYIFSVDLREYSCSGNIFIAAHGGQLYFIEDPI